MSEGENDGTFLVAAARRSGIPRRWVDGGSFDRPYRGVRAPKTPEVPGPAAEAQKAALRRAVARFVVHMSAGEYFSHTTAAVLWELPLPLLPDALPHVSVPGRAPRLTGIHGHQIDPALARVVAHPTLGVRLTDPATTWAMLGGMLRHPYDLVAVGDAVVRVVRIPGREARIERPAWGTRADLEAALEAGRRRGAPALRAALPQIREGVASRTETWLRLTIVDAGLPEPVTDHDVFDACGRFVGCVDLAYPALRIAIEYEGDQHRTDARQWQRDIEKHERLADLGWRVIRVTREHVFGEPSAVIRRVRAAIAAA